VIGKRRIKDYYRPLSSEYGVSNYQATHRRALSALPITRVGKGGAVRNSVQYGVHTGQRIFFKTKTQEDPTSALLAIENLSRLSNFPFLTEAIS